MEVALLRLRLAAFRIKAWIVARTCRPMTEREKDAMRIKLRWLQR